MENNEIPEELIPLSVLDYIGYSLLFAVPLIGLIISCVTAFGKEKNVNLKNYAKAYLIVYAAGIVISCVARAFF